MAASGAEATAPALSVETVESLLAVLCGDAAFMHRLASDEDRENFRLTCREARDLSNSYFTEARIPLDKDAREHIGLSAISASRELAAFHSRLPALKTIRFTLRSDLMLAQGNFDAQRPILDWLSAYLMHARRMGALSHVVRCHASDLSGLPMLLGTWAQLADALPALQDLVFRLSFRCPVLNNNLLPVAAAFSSSPNLRSLLCTVLWRVFEEPTLTDALDLAPLNYLPNLRRFSMPNSCMDDRDFYAMAAGTPNLEVLTCCGLRIPDHESWGVLGSGHLHLSKLHSLVLLGRGNAGLHDQRSVLVCKPSSAVEFTLWQTEQLLTFAPALRYIDGAIICLSDEKQDHAGPRLALVLERLLGCPPSQCVAASSSAGALRSPARLLLGASGSGSGSGSGAGITGAGAGALGGTAAAAGGGPLVNNSHANVVTSNAAAAASISMGSSSAPSRAVHSATSSNLAISLSIPCPAWPSIQLAGPYPGVTALSLTLLDAAASERSLTSACQSVAALFPNVRYLSVELPLLQPEPPLLLMGPVPPQMPMQPRSEPPVEALRALGAGLPCLEACWISIWSSVQAEGGQDGEAGEWVAEVPVPSLALAMALQMRPDGAGPSASSAAAASASGAGAGNGQRQGPKMLLLGFDGLSDVEVEDANVAMRIMGEAGRYKRFVMWPEWLAT